MVKGTYNKGTLKIFLAQGEDQLEDRAEGIMNIIEKYSPDIFGLQELNETGREAYFEGLEERYEVYVENGENTSTKTKKTHLLQRREV